jgi:4'-phosphopantetheinyl transferase
MRTTFGHEVAGIASSLDDECIHVWLLDYRKSQGREPLRSLLGAYLGLPAESVVLVHGEHGRPELAPPWNQPLHFNWSHSGDKAIIAVARGIVPGIDIERVRPRPRSRELTDRFFHPEEAAALSVLDESRREIVFLELWTGKEAVLKALGRGVAFGLHRLHLVAEPGAAHLLWLDGDDAAQWQLCRLQVPIDYIASVAWRGPPRTIHTWTLAERG